MRKPALRILGILGGLLFAVPTAYAAPDSPAPPATPPVTTAPPARAATPTPVPERTAAPVVPTPIRPVSTEKNYKLAQANRLIGWGIGTGVFGGIVTAVGVGLIAYGHTAGGDEHYKTGYGVMGLGLVILAATSPLWIVGMIKRSKAQQTEATRNIVPRDRRLVDTVNKRDQRRMIRASGPPAVPVAAYGFRF